MRLPTTPLSPVPVLFISVADSDLFRFIEEVHALMVESPGLVELIDADLDAHGLKKKALRVEDAAWVAAQTAPLPGVALDLEVVEARGLKLLQGRPRTPGCVVLMAMLLRGYLGAGFKSCDAATLMQESQTLRVYLANVGLRMPGQSTLTELVNGIKNETRERILDAQVARVAGLGWDDFSTVLQDSTHVEGNTRWPTDSGLIVDLVARMLRIGASLPRLNLPVIEAAKAHKYLADMRMLDREIDLMPASRERPRSRRRRYEKLLWRARRVHDLLVGPIAQVAAAQTALYVLPSRKAMAGRATLRLQEDLEALAKAIENCEARIVHETKVPMSEKQLSVSDPDVGFIAKGQRVPVIGYKPQLARSGTGFITALLLPKGNAADSGQLQPMVDAVMRRTGVVPKVLSVDDGYASRANMDAMQARNIEVISINGAKGRALTARADWDSDAFALARDDRSAVESLMFTLKQGFDFGEVARRGLAAVHGELLEKALAYNLCHMVRTRRVLAAAAAKNDHNSNLRRAA